MRSVISTIFQRLHNFFVSNGTGSFVLVLLMRSDIGAGLVWRTVPCPFNNRFPDLVQRKRQSSTVLMAVLR